MNPYLKGLFILKGCLPDKIPETFSDLEKRLLANLHQERLPDFSSNDLAERSEILRELDEFAHQYCRQSFHQLCASDEDAAYPSFSPPPADVISSVNPQSDGPELTARTLPTITYSLLTRAVPIAYCNSTNVRNFPLVTCFIDNSGAQCTDSRLNINIQIEGYGSEDTRYVEVAKGESKSIALLPLLQPSLARRLTAPEPANLRINVHYLYPYLEEHRYAERIHLHAYNTALLAQETKNGRILDLTRYLAAWVTPFDEAIEQLLSLAAEFYNQGRSFPGYNIPGNREEKAWGVRKQVKSLFETLKRQVNLHYVSSTYNFLIDGSQIVQRVRLPADILKSGGSANCMDGTVLFASLLELASLRPSIVIVPGHAFVAWKVYRNENLYECLETTIIRQADFETAVKSATRRLQKARQNNDFSRRLFDLQGFARIIDINDCRTKGIQPLQ